jgi:hypothetical protein
VQLDSSNTKLRVYSSQKLTLLNENHLLELLGLTKAVTDDEYNEYLEPSLVGFIESQPYLNKKGGVGTTTDNINESCEEDGVNSAIDTKKINE